MLTRTILVLAVNLFSSFIYLPTGDVYSLTVEAHSSRNANGVIQFSLYNKDGSIPDEHFEKYYKMKTSKIINGKASVTFTGLPPGEYAVNILHDENDNGKVDKGFLLPKEGLGFSNYESLGFANRPKYSKASFALTNDMHIRIKVIYM